MPIWNVKNQRRHTTSYHRLELAHWHVQPLAEVDQVAEAVLVNLGGRDLDEKRLISETSHRTYPHVFMFCFALAKTCEHSPTVEICSKMSSVIFGCTHSQLVPRFLFWHLQISGSFGIDICPVPHNTSHIAMLGIYFLPKSRGKFSHLMLFFCTFRIL